MYLEEFYDYKNQFIQDLLTSENILSLLHDDLKIDDNVSNLIFTQIFPCEYVPDAVEHGKTFICFDVDIQRSINKTYLIPTMYVWIFTHKSKLMLPKGGLRIDKLASEISRVVNGSRYYGLGQLDLYSVKRFSPISDYSGKVMMFQAEEFNRNHSKNNTAPSNRKKG